MNINLNTPNYFYLIYICNYELYYPVTQLRIVQQVILLFTISIKIVTIIAINDH